MGDITLRPATPADAPLIGRAVVMAVGEDHAAHMNGGRHTLDEIRALFADLASRDDSQYSYRNTIVADVDGTPAASLTAYDGARLPRLRRAFVDAAADRLGMHIDPDRIPDETVAGEYYIDSLAVLDEYRHRGIARRLLDEAIRSGHALGLTPALLVDPDNTAALTLYTSLGFRNAGTRPFLGIPMLVMHHDA